MSFTTKVFEKHGFCRATIWCDDGYETECIALRDRDGRVLYGVASKPVYERIKNLDNFLRSEILRSSDEFENISGIEIHKEGLFALSKVTITTESSYKLRGKVDKGFAQLLKEGI